MRRLGTAFTLATAISCGGDVGDEVPLDAWETSQAETGSKAADAGSSAGEGGTAGGSSFEPGDAGSPRNDHDAAVLDGDAAPSSDIGADVRADDAAAEGPDASSAEPAGVFVAVGYGGRTVRSVDDGTTWIDDVSLVPKGGDDDHLLRTVVWAGHEFVALGWRVMKSPDGKTWVDHGTIIGQWIGAVAYAQSSLVAIGGYGLRVTSSDALVFQHHDVDTVASHAHDGLAFGDYQGGRFVACNDDGKRSYSDDGRTWKASAGAEATKTFEIAFGNGVFAAIGTRDVLVSRDGGATFSAAATLPGNVIGLVFGKDHFTALANGHVFTSADGRSWEDHVVGGMTGGALAYGHGTYVLVNGTARSRSKDGLVWQASASGGANALEWVAFGSLR